MKTLLSSRRASIELLEARIAPAVVVNFSTDLKTASWIDQDGDFVTLKASKAIFNPNDLNQFRFLQDDPAEPGGQLAQLDLRTMPGAANGVSLTFSARRDRVAHLGDGTVHVGRIDAKGFDLGTVNISGDLGSIAAGDPNLATAAIKSIVVSSSGAFGTNTQGPELGGQPTFINWQFLGAVGAITVKGDSFAAIDARDNQAPNGVNLQVGIGTVNIWGDLRGGDVSQTGYAEAGAGYIFTEGALGTVKIGGDMVGGTSPLAGSVRTAGGNIGSLAVGGNVFGGGAAFTGGAFGGVIKKVIITGTLYGAGGDSSGSIFGSTISSLTVGGIVGGGAANSGSIIAGTLGTINILGSLSGGSAPSTGVVAGDTVTSVNVRESVVGGTASDSGEIYGTFSLGKVTVGNSLIGGSSGRDANQVIELISRTGAIGSDGKIGSVFIGQNVFPGVADFSGAIFTSLGSRGDIGTVTIVGTLAGFSNFDAGDGTGIYPINGIYADGRLGAVKVGAISGTSPLQPAQIVAMGRANPGSVADALAIASVTVARGSYAAQILAGYSRGAEATDTQVVVNPDVQIGAVKIGHHFIGSSVAAGVVGLDHGFGDPANTVVGQVPGFGDNASIPARIASLTIGGYILGNPQNTPDFYTGVVAQQIGAVKIGATVLEMTPNSPSGPLDIFELGFLPRFFIREVA